MINKVDLKKKSDELNIPFSNMLSGVICEAILEILSKSSYSNELILSNGSHFNKEIYKDFCIGTIYFDYVKELDDKLVVLYLRDILKEIISKAAQEALIVEGKVENETLKLQISVKEMYVPVTIIFSKGHKTTDTMLRKIKLTYFENREISFFESPKEDILVKNIVEIVEKLELINNMDCYYDVYEILSTSPINGRKVKDLLLEKLKEKNISIDKTRFEILASYRDYSYMKKKWKVELRQKKKSEPNWTDIVDCLIKFLEPIWTCMESNLVFLGDWMPQIKRFLD